MSFLVDKIDRQGTVSQKQGDNSRNFCRCCRKLIREGEKYRVRQVPMPFRRRHDWVYTHHPGCPNKGEG